MEENKFEKQVQQKMDELKIHPSDSVWEKIERRIEKKKRSNPGLFLLVVIFLLFLTGAGLLWNHVQHSINETNNFEKSTGKISIKENKNGQVKPNFMPGSVNSKNKADENAFVKKNNNKNSFRPYKISDGKKINLKINPGEKATIVLSIQQEVKNTIFENANNKPGIIRPGDIPQENEKIKVDIKDSAYDKLDMGNLPKPLFLQYKKDKTRDTVQQILTSTETTKYSKKNKWRPGVLLSGGTSGAGNNFLGHATPAPSYLNSVGQGTQPGTTSAGIPSVTKPAFGFIIGVFAEKNISKKGKLLLGINFKSFNTSNKVGFRNNTTGFYALNTVSVYDTYTNHYNFMELPVTLKVQIGKGKNIPLFWEGGFVVSELISSNALQFNQSSGYYYANNSVFNKTQIGLNTDISVALFSKQKTSILIGPYFYYGTSSLAREGLYNKKHFVFTGLRTEILFGK